MSAVALLTKACEYDAAGRRLEALKLYEDGIRELLQTCKNETDSIKKSHFQVKIKEYIVRAEQIKETIQRCSTKGEVIDRIHIIEGATGYTYERILGKYLNNDVREIELEEPYLREQYQLTNLVIFLELVVRKCTSIKFAKLKTTPDPRSSSEQLKALQSIKKDLHQRGIELYTELVENLHDRQIILSNGYIIKIGRGLHIFKATSSRYTLGLTDYSFRECRDTHIDIFKCLQ